MGTATNPLTTAVERWLPIDSAVWAAIPGRPVVVRGAFDRWRPGREPDRAEEGLDLSD